MDDIEIVLLINLIVSLCIVFLLSYSRYLLMIR